jgi:hypothetical protein
VRKATGNTSLISSPEGIKASGPVLGRELIIIIIFGYL